MVNNHGDRKSPKDRAVPLSNGRSKRLINGEILTTDTNWPWTPKPP